MIEIETADQLSDIIDQEYIYPDQIQFTKTELQNYLALSQDQTDIHNPETNENPIIPGNMILMVVPRYLQQMIIVKKSQSIMTVGYDKVSFKSPLYLDQAFELSLTCTKSRKMGDGYLLSQAISLRDPQENKLFAKIQVSDLYR